MSTLAGDGFASTVGGWNAVKLTEARQVEALVGGDPDDWCAPEIGVRDRYEELRRTGRLSDALAYLGHSLPRLEAVAWAARIVADAASTREPAQRARRALDTALRWLDDPTDIHRRAARVAADVVGNPGAEQCLGYAVFYSGGSVAPVGSPMVPPPAHACLRFAVSAIAQVAYRGVDTDAVLTAALDLGEAIAERGLEALARP